MKDKLECNCNFCIYNENNKCCLRETSLNEFGQCREVIFLGIEDGLADFLKERTFENLVRNSSE